MRPVLASLVVLLLSGGCASTATSPSAPAPADFPPLPRPSVPEPPKLRPFRLDVPRDLSRPQVRDDPACTSVPETGRDADWEERCVTWPPLDDSNILFGFTPEDWEAFGYDMQVLRAWIRAVLEALRAHEEALDRYEREILRRPAP